MKTTLLLSTAFLLLAPSAFALNDDVNSNTANGNSQAFQNTGSINGSTINNGSGSGSVLSGGSATANGGAGGSATARSGDSTSAVIGSGNSSATGGSVRDSGNSSIRNSGNSRSTSSARQHQSQSQSAASNVAGSGNSNVNVAAQKRNPVSSAFSAPLVASEDTCTGSSSAGAQGIGFGVSLGSTWTDGDCVRRKDARELHNMGYKDAAISLMCQNEHVRAAMATAGTPCAAPEEPETSYESPVRDERPGNGSRNR
ncbi:MAG: hypothetical protein K8U57_37030 [Planctomycetes bacterium]|nr:hypothetical protein [Planctomycetota bacterium]